MKEETAPLFNSLLAWFIIFNLENFRYLHVSYTDLHLCSSLAPRNLRSVPRSQLLLSTVILVTSTVLPSAINNHLITLIDSLGPKFGQGTACLCPTMPRASAGRPRGRGDSIAGARITSAGWCWPSAGTSAPKCGPGFLPKDGSLGRTQLLT